ncbi:hypothetical protein CYMTET_23388 [Cymbomonas tetramitiformis]|uniref:Uncharacterized protein n=1 Tax=Cymbomonas tetramitiformis TaxID=36881 RepID=A0AAE0FYB4_9CHLO|nr:hypothetical protein CYMTET_23388 [Cymbomonas tetramitiformis]
MVVDNVWAQRCGVQARGGWENWVHVGMLALSFDRNGVRQAFIIAWVVYTDVEERFPRMLVWTAGLLFAKMTMHLMLAHICEEPLQLMRKTYLPMFAAAAYLTYSTAVEGLLPGDEMHGWLLYGLAAVAVWAYVHFCYHVIRECCEVLDVYCLRIKPKDKAK